MIRGRRALSPSTARSSAIRFATLASETNVPGQRVSWIRALETAFGLFATRISSRPNALGERSSVRPPLEISRVPESKTQPPKARRTSILDQRNREETLDGPDDFP